MGAAREEWISKFGDDSLFDAYDLDGDGSIDADEFLKGKQATKAMNQADTDHDGKLCKHVAHTVLCLIEKLVCSARGVGS